MELQQLRNFKTVAELENISRAAERLYMSQPNLSTSLKRLENDLGLQLLLHRRGKISLTACGKVFYDYVNRALEELDMGISAVRRTFGGAKGMVKLASPLPDLSADVLQAFLLKNPSISIKQYNYVNQACMDALIEGTADLAMLFGPLEDSGLVFEPIDTCPRVMMLPNKHPLAKEREVVVERLEGENCILNQSRGDERFYNWLEQLGVKTRIVCECDSDLVETNMLSGGMGVSVGPLLNYIKLKNTYPQLQISMVLLKEPVPPVMLGVAYQKGHILTAEERALCDIFRSIFSEEGNKGKSFLSQYEKDYTI